jgi:hypothetical protein|tara:strand:+ start:590 stop:886 length:297 start_codon:yes stop_codon:yes gene_type:complete
MSDHGHDEGHAGAPDERQHVWDNPKNVKLLFNVFYALCVILVVLGLIPRQEVPGHEGHPLEGFFAFYPLYGFVGIVLLVLIAKLMRRVLMRPEDYYDG